METKTLKIEIPNGYAIDKEKSTFENIVFKKVDDAEIKWNENCFGVEIKTDNEHFILDGNPDHCMNWDNAMSFDNNKHRGHTWKLPTVKQLKIIHNHFNEINKVIEENDGFKLIGTYYWSCENIDEFLSQNVNMYSGYTYSYNKGNNIYARVVSTL